MAHNKTLQAGHAQMPNYFGHVTEQAVRASFNRFNDIFLIAPKECSSMLARFLCPMYAPSCADSKTLLPPCREFCVQTRSQCKRFINQAHRQNSFQWPTDLKCKNFPRKDEASCYMGPSTEVAISRPPPVPGKIYLRRVLNHCRPPCPPGSIDISIPWCAKQRLTVSGILVIKTLKSWEACLSMNLHKIFQNM